MDGRRGVKDLKREKGVKHSSRLENGSGSQPRLPIVITADLSKKDTAAQVHATKTLILLVLGAMQAAALFIISPK